KPDTPNPQNGPWTMTRRQTAQDRKAGGGLQVPGPVGTLSPKGAAMSKKPVAAIVTEYRKWSHADVIVGKVLEGFNYDGGDGPDLKLVSMYVDQFPDKDMSRDLAKKYGFTIHETIEAALTQGGKELAVEGVLCIGEHGKYPDNDKGQKLYPRRRFF